MIKEWTNIDGKDNIYIVLPKCEVKDTSRVFCLLDNSIWTNSTLYKYRKISANKGTQQVPVEIPIVRWNTVPPNIINMLSMDMGKLKIQTIHLHHMYCCIQLYLYQNTRSLPRGCHTNNAYRRLPFLWRRVILRALHLTCRGRAMFFGG